MIVRNDCKHFKGDVPCKPHKKFQVHCENCEFYEPIKYKILIIKLGALGDVLRTTPLLRKIKTIFPDSYVYWLTNFPEILKNDLVDSVLTPNIENLEFIKQLHFDWVINLDKEPLAISLTKIISSDKKSGFIINEFGKASPISNEAEKHKWLTGIFDDVSKINNKHYVEEIFDICQFQFNDEKYVLNIPTKSNNWDIDRSKKIIGLNTGCGARWSSRLWPINHWVELANILLSQNYEVILLGGQDEDARNKEIQSQTGAKYFGYFALDKFIDLMDNCDLIVTAVTMALHLAIALKKKIILFNNVFNKNEFYLYGLGEILEPDIQCDCYYKSECSNNCMNYLLPSDVLNAIYRIL